MTRKSLVIPDEYTAALSEHFHFDLSSENLATRIGKSYIKETAEIVSHISKGLTTNRKEFFESGYLQKKEIRQAYTLYFMTTNLLKMIQPLTELSLSNFFERDAPLRILDLGTGTGAATWGTLMFLLDRRINNNLLFTLTDSLQENLIVAEQFSRHLLPGLKFEQQLLFEKIDLRELQKIPVNIKKSAPYDIITMMNVLNELDENNDAILFEEIMSLLDAHGALIIIEPATRIQSRRLLRFRDLAATKGATVYSPCTRQADCPALKSQDDWCHTDIPWERPPFIKAIDDLVGTLRLSLKSTYFILRKDGMTINQALGKEILYRVVSERFEEKGRIRAIMCSEIGRKEYLINKRDIGEFNQDFGKMERYDIASLIGEVVREHDSRLLKQSIFDIVLPILGAR